MDIQIEEKEYCKIAVHYSAGIDYIAAKEEQVINRLQSSARVPGFRPGKATAQAIKIKMRPQLDSLIQEELAHEAFRTTVASKNLKHWGNPQFTNVDLKKDKFSCSFDLLLFPTVVLNQYKNFEVPKYAPKFDTIEFGNQAIEELRYKHGEVNPYTEQDSVQMKDSIIINCETKLEDNTPVPEITFNGQLVQVGTLSNYVPGLDEQLLGMKLEETKDFFLKMPADFQNPQYADKVLMFKVSLLMGSRITPNALDDTFANKIGFDNLQALQSAMYSEAASRLQELEQEYLFEQLSNRLIENHIFQVPEWLSLYEAQLLAAQSQLRWSQITDEEKLAWLERAEKNIRLALVLDMIRETEPDAQLSDQEALAECKKHLFKRFKTEEDVAKQLQTLMNNNQINILLTKVKDDYTFEFILKNSTIVE